MSGALAIAGVTAALKDLLNDGLLDHDLSSIGSFSVTAQPPDRITTGENEDNRLNLFLYQVSANPGWRNEDLPSRNAAGMRISNPPLALDLRYLLTAYGAQDMNAEVLMGYAMELLHETPVLARAQLRIALGTPSPIDGSLLPGVFGSLSAADLADQVEQLKITPEFLNPEELSKLWTAMQARYRLSMSYLVTVVLIRRNDATRVAPPVLQRGAGDRGPIASSGAPPTLGALRNLAAALLPAARLGDDLALVGTNLATAGPLSVVFEAARLGIVNVLPINAGAGDPVVHLPDPAQSAAAMTDWAAGVYTVSLRVTLPGQPPWTTNGMALALAPSVVITPLTAAPATPVTLTVSCAPRLLPAQNAGVRLLIGTSELAPASIVTPADPAQPTTLTFDVPGQPAGQYLLRLRVDGIDSLPVLITGTPPAFSFDPAQQLVVA